MDIRKEAKQRALLKCVEEQYLKYYRMQIRDGNYDVHKVFKNDKFQQICEYNKTPDMSTVKWYLLTINPADDPNSNMEDKLRATVSKIMTYKNFIYSEGNVHWSLEQRSDNPDEPYGWHVHIAFPNVNGVSLADLKRRVRAACNQQKLYLSPKAIDFQIRKEDIAKGYVSRYKHCDEEIQLGPQGIYNPLSSWQATTKE